jgi:hypothetical protein
MLPTTSELASWKSHRKAEQVEKKFAAGAWFSWFSLVGESLQAVTRPAPNVAAASQIIALMVLLRG